jgi:alpha-L-fucosidase
MKIERFHDARDWFFEKRLGLFIHWGLYAIHGLHEQEQQRYGVPADEYAKLIGEFDPKAFDPEEWLDIAQDAAMEYMVLTAKHHDGFCLWDSSLTGFKATATPFGRDVVGEIAEACHKRKFPLELYYSVVDWRHPAYPNIGRHHEIETDPAKHSPDEYMAYLKGQIRELCSNYGEIHGIWWDMNAPGLKDPSIHAMIRELQPAAIINNRGFDDGDYSTPERDWNPEGANPDDRAFKRPTEACQSVGANSWGFRADEDYYSVRYFMKRIDATLAMGGNYLLNVGPDADGSIPEPSRRILRGVGNWMRRMREAFAAEPVAGLFDNPGLLATRSKDALYIHCLEEPSSSTISLRPFAERPRRAVSLNDGRELEASFEPIVYERHLPPALRIRGLPVEELAGIYR